MTTNTPISTMLMQSWENASDAEDAQLYGGGSELDMPYRGYAFFDDGTVVQNPRDRMRYGTYLFDPASKKIKVSYRDGTKEELTVKAIGPKSMLLKKGKDKEEKYVAEGWKHQNRETDPFYPSNNQWRIKPRQAESSEAVKARAEQCARFYAMYMESNFEKGGNTISFAGIPTCFKWYRGGISVMTKDKLDAKFINCFYNETQAKQAQQLLEKAITKKYQWNRKESNYVRQWADVLKQYCDTLKGLSMPQ